jgi:hypothetical protein
VLRASLSSRLSSSSRSALPSTCSRLARR